MEIVAKLNGEEIDMSDISEIVKEDISAQINLFRYNLIKNQKSNFKIKIILTVADNILYAEFQELEL